MNELEQRREQIETDLRNLKANGFSVNAPEVIDLENSLADVLAQMDAVKAQQRKEQIEEKVHAEPVPFTSLGINLDGMPLQMINLVEKVYRTTLKNTLNEHAIELDILDSKLKECEAVGLERAREIDLINFEFKNSEERWMETTKELSDKIYRITAELADAESKRDAAVNAKEAAEEALRQANEEIKSLYVEIEEYKQAEEYRARQEQPLNLTEEDTNDLQAAADAVKKLFVGMDDWGSVIKVTKQDGSFELVKRSELESDWQQAGVEVPAAEEPVQSIEPPVMSFPEVPEHTTNGTVDETGTGEVETFEQEVRRRLATLETAVYGEDKAVA